MNPLLPLLTAAATACGAPEFRQFDFWIGQWEVFAPDGKKAGDNRIEPILGGCALAEHWSGQGGFSGTSLNSYSPATRQWHQHWVDGSGGLLRLAGGLQGAAMVMAMTHPHRDKPEVTVTQRITWTPNADGSVRQLWERSEDGGRSWSVVFDGRYVKRR